MSVDNGAGVGECAEEEEEDLPVCGECREGTLEMRERRRRRSSTREGWIKRRKLNPNTGIC